MDINNKKCSYKDHEKIDALSYCRKCEIYMCNKCLNLHSQLLQKHQLFTLEKGKEIFTGLCQEKEHNSPLNFFCKTHNKLCCAICICKIKMNEIGNHKDCDACIINDIQNEKKSKLKENIKYLDELSNKLQNSINNLKIIFDKKIKNIEEIKINIQKIFTKIRNELNNGEEQILLELQKEYNNLYLNEEIFKKNEKLSEKIKFSLEKGYKIEKEWEKYNNLNLLINDCINIENNINDFRIINENLKKFNNSNNIQIKFSHENEEEINFFFENIKNFCKILKNDAFLKSSLINNDIDKQNIIIKWIKEKINKTSIKFELIFKMSEYGPDPLNFHKTCDNKGPTLVLVKTKNNKIFGGFTPLNWKNSGRYICDNSNQTFIFSLNLMKKYDMINNKRAIFCDSRGPCFGRRF